MTHASLVGRWPTDTDKIAAVARLGLLKDSTPSLVAAEADARATLESALVAYGNALADRLRGTTTS